MNEPMPSDLEHPGPMLALSVGQPWASLIAAGKKRVVTRPWRRAYRGPIAIYASSLFAPEGRVFAASDVVRRAMGDMAVRDYPLGAVLAVCMLQAYVPTESVVGRLSALERAVGDYTPGCWAFLLDDIRPLPHPIKAHGRQFLWRWRPDDRSERGG